MRASLALVALLLAAAWAPVALAQDHAHGTGDGAVLVLRDGPEDGRVVVGSLTHFGFALLSPDGVPLVHRNANFTLVQAGRVLFATEDTHEYDGLFGLDVQFTRPGPFAIVAMSEEMAMGTWTGEAVLPETPVTTTILFEPAAPALGSSAFGGALSVVDEAGVLVPHTDLLVEVRRAGDERLVARSHLHVHDEAASFTQSAPAGDYVLSVVGYEAFPRAGGSDVRPSVASFPVTVGPLPGLPAPAPPRVPGALQQAQGSATAGAFTLHGMVDPQNQVGVGQAVRFAGILVDANGSAVPHVDFTFRLDGPQGRVFDSESLHEYDGVHEYVLVPDAPGQYDATLTAHTDAGDVTVAYQVHVVPPAAPISGAGVGTVSVTGLDDVSAGDAREVTFLISGPQGPVQHSEVDVTLYHDDEAPVYQFKLHTHASGETRATLIVPHAGDWTLRVDPIPTVPQAVVFQGPAGPDAPITFAFAATAPLNDAPDATPEATPDAKTVPAAGWTLLLAGIAVALARQKPARPE